MKVVNTGTALQKKYKKHALKNSVVKWIIKKLIHFGQIENVKGYITPFGSLADPIFNAWDTEYFNAVYDRYKNKTLLSKASLYTLLELAKSCILIDGIFVELGTYKGGSARALANTTGRKMHCFDTFEGVTGVTLADSMEEGEFGDVDIDDVVRYLYDCALYPGKVPGELKWIRETNIAFIHIDLDLYLPIYESLEALWPWMLPGGIIVFDDYGTLSTTGAMSACDLFFQDKKENLIVLQTGQAFVIKR